LNRQLVEWLLDVHGRHVDEHVEPAECIDGVVDRSLAGVREAEISLNQKDAPTERSQAVGGFFGFCSRTAVNQRYIGAAAR
jgi:hypothetical protein